jgi:pimeloyl-ACP methyl ester carboxylesterase
VVIVEGREVRVLDEGTGPTVVLEAGAGATLDSWARVIPLLTPEARVVAYDRSGLGFSDPMPAPDDRRPRAVAAQLDAILAAVGAPPPYVLVGHSIGGLYVRAFAERRPDAVAGLVLVDPSHEDMQKAVPTPRAEKVLGTVVKGMLRAAAWLGPLGAPRLLTPLLMPKATVTKLALEPDHVAAIRTRYGRADAIRAIYQELAQLTAALDQTRELQVPPSIPVTVLSGDRFDRKASNPDTRRLINELHAALAATSDAGRHVVVDCGHLVPIDRPEAVADAVLTMVREQRPL